MKYKNIYGRDNKCCAGGGEIHLNWGKWRKGRGGGRILDVI